jgi:hypothetical protein
MSYKAIINFDFVSLYPTVEKGFAKLDVKHLIKVLN